MNWQWLSLGDPEYAEPSRPPDVAGLLYTGLRHVISGPPESTKTLVAAILSLTAQREGTHGDFNNGWAVAHVDLEMGARRTRALLEDLGATPQEVADTHYTEPAGPPSARDIQYLAGNGFDLVTVDAAAGAYNVTGLDDNARKDVEAFAAQWIDPLYRAGVASLLLDHVTKNTDARGKYAIGSERKAGQADVHLGLELVGQPLVRGGKATVKVRVHKDRPGWLARPYAAELHLTSDPDTHRIGWEWREPATATAQAQGSGWRPTIYMQRVQDHLAEHGPMSRTAVYKAGLGKREYLVQAVECLIEDGNLEEVGSRLVPANTSPSVPDGSRVPKRFPTVPGSPLALGSHGSPLYRGEPGNGEVADEELDRLQAIADEMDAA